LVNNILRNKSDVMSVERLKKYRKFLIILVYFVAVVIGFGSCFKSEQINLLFSFFIAALLTNLCIIDSKIVGKPLPFFSYFFVFIFFGIAAPICIIRAHGIKRGIKIILIHLVGLFLTAFATVLVCSFSFHQGCPVSIYLNMV